MSKKQRLTQEWYYYGDTRYSVVEVNTDHAPAGEFQRVNQNGFREVFVLVEVVEDSNVLAQIGLRYCSHDGGMVLESVGLMCRRHGFEPHIHDTREVPTVVGTSPYWEANAEHLDDGEPVSSMGSDPYGNYRIDGLIAEHRVRVERTSTGNVMWHFFQHDGSVFKVPNDLLGITLGKCRAAGLLRVEVQQLKGGVKRVQAAGDYDFTMPKQFDELIKHA